jgi:serine/threonine protein phosphatase PrpC
MGRYINGKWINIDLSHDQKPNNPGEKERILAHGGRIEAYKDENGGDFGPPRVWLKNEDIPGLAMSRSFGDEVAASVGTISEPEIEEYEITEDDKFIIIASDGIWEFISSQECVEFIKDFYEKKDLKGCLKFLLNESSKRWIKEEEVIDDITAVLIFFEN